MNKQNNRTIGKSYEEKAAKYLEQNGYTIIDVNFNCKIGEIDIIAKDKEYLVFVEVKYRKNLLKGDPSEAINYYKQRTITKVAQYYLLKKRMSFNIPCRFDVVVIIDEQIRLIKNAFEARWLFLWVLVTLI